MYFCVETRQNIGAARIAHRARLQTGARIPLLHVCGPIWRDRRRLQRTSPVLLRVAKLSPHWNTKHSSLIAKRENDYATQRTIFENKL
jgi:hypothetical protein